MAAKKAAPEVIQEWADGEGVYTFERGRMEAAVRKLCFEEPVELHSSQKATAKSSIKVKKEDVDFIVRSRERICCLFNDLIYLSIIDERTYDTSNGG